MSSPNQCVANVENRVYAARKIFLLISILGSLISINAVSQVQFESGSIEEDGALIFSSPPPARDLHSMVYDSVREEIIMFGGWNGSTATTSNQTFSWDGTAWTEKNPPNFPSIRYEHRMVFAAFDDRSVVVLFGGYNPTSGITSDLNDTWEWDGQTWTRIDTPAAPSIRRSFAMAFDPVDKVVVLFGGRSGNAILSDTWEYNGVTWSLKNTSSSPTAVRKHGMEYDPVNDEIVLFGGSTSTGNSPTDQTWTYNGTNWTMESPGTMPGSRYAHDMVWDPIRNKVVIFGGFGNPGNNELNEVWEWDGSTWSSVAIAQGSPEPTRRSGMAMAYLQTATQNQLVMFGGFQDVSNVRANDTWILNNDNSWTAPLTAQPNPVIDMTFTTTDTNGDPITLSKSIWNYKSIHIPSGVTVTFKRNALNTPVIWLASGDVVINGTIDIRGKNAGDFVDPGTEAKGGPGGFNGGLGGKDLNVSSAASGTAGLGPGGGAPGITNDQFGGGGGFGIAGLNEGNAATTGGNIYSNPAIVPIVGGSGAGGGGSRAGENGGAGGAGGGAILIASSGSIILNGVILANGGNKRNVTGDGGYGSGGAIKLVANSISGSGRLHAHQYVGSTTSTSNNSWGRIRLEAFSVNLSGTVWPPPSSSTPQTLNMADFIDNQPQIIITSVGGQTVTTNESSDDTGNPDVVFTQTGDIIIDFQTVNIPAGETLSVRVTSANQPQVTLGTSSAITIPNPSTEPNIGVASATISGVPAGVGTVQAWANYNETP